MANKAFKIQAEASGIYGMGKYPQSKENKGLNLKNSYDEHRETAYKKKQERLAAIEQKARETAENEFIDEDINEDISKG